MAQIYDQGENLILKLSLWEKLGSFHKDLKVSKDNLISKQVIENPWSRQVLKGMRAPGTGIPYFVLLGTMRYKDGKDFTAIYRRKPVTVYEFKDYEYKRWIVTN